MLQTVRDRGDAKDMPILFEYIALLEAELERVYNASEYGSMMRDWR